MFSAKVRRSEGWKLYSQKRQEIYIHIRFRPALEHIRFPITLERDVFSLGLIRLSHGVSQTLPSVAEVKNGWSYTPNPQFAFITCLEINWAQCIAL